MNNNVINFPRKKRQWNSTEKRRREILDAALKCFLKRGVAGTTIEQIRAASNASHGSIYHLFSGKDEIALTLFVEGMHIYNEKIIEAMGQQSTSFGCVRAMIAAHLNDVADDPALAIYMTRLGVTDDLKAISEQYQPLIDKFAQSVSSCLEPFVERGEIVRLPSELYYSLIVGPAVHLSRNWLRCRTSFDLLSSIDHLAEAAWKSLQPGELKLEDNLS